MAALEDSELQDELVVVAEEEALDIEHHSSPASISIATIVVLVVALLS